MPDWQPVSVPDLCSACGAYWECECFSVRLHNAAQVGRIISSRIKDAPTKADLPSNPWAPDQPLGKRLGAALDRQFPEITATTDPAVREAVNEKADRIERAMTEIWDELGLDA